MIQEEERAQKIIPSGNATEEKKQPSLAKIDSYEKKGIRVTNPHTGPQNKEFSSS